VYDDEILDKEVLLEDKRNQGVGVSILKDYPEQDNDKKIQ